MHRELGLIAFGNPQAYDVPDFVDEPLADIFLNYLQRHGIPEEVAIWDASYGTNFPEGKELVVRPYDWGWDGEDEDMLPNIEFRGIRLWWYKYLGRSMTTDQKISEKRWRQWLDDLRGYAVTTD